MLIVKLTKTNHILTMSNKNNININSNNDTNSISMNKNRSHKFQILVVILNLVYKLYYTISYSKIKFGTISDIVHLISCFNCQNVYALFVSIVENQLVYFLQNLHISLK